LHLLQYPLRPSYRAYGDQGELTKVDVANEGQEVESLRMHYKLATQSQNYDGNAVDHRVSACRISRVLDTLALFGELEGRHAEPGAAELLRLCPH